MRLWSVSAGCCRGVWSRLVQGMTGRLGRRAGLRMLAEKGCDPSGDVDAFMIVLQRVKGMIHPVFSIRSRRVSISAAV